MRLFKRKPKPVKYEETPTEYIPSAFLTPDVAESLKELAYRQGPQAAYLVQKFLINKYLVPKKRWWE